MADRSHRRNVDPRFVSTTRECRHVPHRPGGGVTSWRRGWDSNPRSLSTQRFSRAPPSTTRPPLRGRGYRCVGRQARIAIAWSDSPRQRREGFKTDCSRGFVDSRPTNPGRRAVRAPLARVAWTPSQRVGGAASMESRSMYRRRTSGTSTDPSGRWYVSRMAATTRASASPDPLSVWTSSGFAPGSGR